MPKYKKLPIIGLVHEWMYVEVFFGKAAKREMTTKFLCSSFSAAKLVMEVKVVKNLKFDLKSTEFKHQVQSKFN